jgi:hypothetical protein
VSTWRVLAPGRSLREQYAELEPDDVPTVAINGAIRLPALRERRPTRLFWCVLDGPGAQKENREAAVLLEPNIVAGKFIGSRPEAWSAYAPRKVLFMDGLGRMAGTLNKRLRQTGLRKAWRFEDWARQRRSIVFAICAPIFLDGLEVDRIELLGADMNGASDWNAETGEPIQRTVTDEGPWEKRWAEERGFVEGARRDLAALGIDLMVQEAAEAL